MFLNTRTRCSITPQIYRSCTFGHHATQHSGQISFVQVSQLKFNTYWSSHLCNESRITIEGMKVEIAGIIQMRGNDFIAMTTQWQLLRATLSLLSPLLFSGNSCMKRVQLAATYSSQTEFSALIPKIKEFKKRIDIHSFHPTDR